jgi:hypothetical protein
MSAIITRRSLLRGLCATPAIVAASSLMPLRGLAMSPLDSMLPRAYEKEVFISHAHMFGQYTVPPDIVARLGGGDLKCGYAILDRWVRDLNAPHFLGQGSSRLTVWVRDLNAPHFISQSSSRLTV